MAKLRTTDINNLALTECIVSFRAVHSTHNPVGHLTKLLGHTTVRTLPITNQPDSIEQIDDIGVEASAS